CEPGRARLRLAAGEDLEAVLVLGREGLALAQAVAVEHGQAVVAQAQLRQLRELAGERLGGRDRPGAGDGAVGQGRGGARRRVVGGAGGGGGGGGGGALPNASASGAETARPVRTMSIARDCPIRRARRNVPPSIRGTPQRRQNTPKVAPSSATRRSHQSASSRP